MALASLSDTGGVPNFAIYKLATGGGIPGSGSANATLYSKMSAVDIADMLNKILTNVTIITPTVGLSIFHQADNTLGALSIPAGSERTIELSGVAATVMGEIYANSATAAAVTDAYVLVRFAA
jgi:hypothetical protein